MLKTEEIRELYEKDFYRWVHENLELLRKGEYDLVDWENLLEEVEYMARKYEDELKERLGVYMEHRYKIENFKKLAGNETAGSGWNKSILNQLVEISRILEDNPSLRSKLPGLLQPAWGYALKRLKAWLIRNKFNPEDFNLPEMCPYGYEDIMKDIAKF
ncbi:MAG: DUF29 domain-containing protein [Aquificaceae bacterium]|jgi:hypothetical protein|uniref:DUF29 domain-containing protein n=1 Tax=Hydrogenobacter sp. Uz 6-8 TaxID=3384828 RepID=UPI0030B71BA1